MVGTVVVGFVAVVVAAVVPLALSVAREVLFGSAEPLPKSGVVPVPGAVDFWDPPFVRRLLGLSTPLAARLRVLRTALPFIVSRVRTALRRRLMMARREPQPAETSERTPLTQKEVEELVRDAKDAGASQVAFLAVAPEALFAHTPAPYERCVVVMVEPDRAAVRVSPSAAADAAYAAAAERAGIVCAVVESRLRSLGHNAVVAPPHVAHVPLLAERAGLGWRGRHGLLISPGCGPAQGAGLVFTNATGLPLSDGSARNPHSWIGEYCEGCGACARRRKCFEYMSEHLLCSSCVSVCPFFAVGYEAVHARFHAHKASDNMNW
eukprot:m51a1_g4214 hypothetical protein (322) ;mRNA; f:71860-73006